MEKQLDMKSALESTLAQKQESVRNNQRFSSLTSDTELSQMYKDFADADALHATQIKDKLSSLS